MAQKLTFASKEAIEALMHVVQPRYAMIAMIDKNVEVFDAPIGDACCHMRTSPVNDGATIIHAHLTKTGKTDYAVEQARAYEKLHANDKAPGKVKLPYIQEQWPRMG